MTQRVAYAISSGSYSDYRVEIIFARRELRGANAEEAPGAYKRLDEVLAYHEGTIKILHTLTPLGVAMAPGDTRDPYKD